MKKILVVEDFLTMAERTGGIMNRSDLLILSAESTDDALKIHRKEKADLVIVDLRVAGMTPEAFCSAIRENPATRETSILIACRDVAGEIDRVMKCKANDYITKPIDPARLLQKVGQLLNIAERKSCRILLKISVDGKAEDGKFFGTSQNISLTGMLIKAEKKLPVSRKISCSFFLPGSERIIADAEVVREVPEAGSWQYGIRFIDLDLRHRSMIEAFINSRNKARW